MTFIFNNKIKIFLGLLIAVVLFHLSILLKIIPYNIAWGGRLSNDNEMYVFETVSILINAFLFWVLLMKGNFTRFKFSVRTLNVILWIFFAIFVLNTVGNLFAKTVFEQSLTVLTAIFALLTLLILIQKTEA